MFEIIKKNKECDKKSLFISREMKVDEFWLIILMNSASKMFEQNNHKTFAKKLRWPFYF